MVTNAAQAWGVLFGAVIIWALVGVARHWREMLAQRVPASAAGIGGALRRAFPVAPGAPGVGSVLADLGARGLGWALALGAGFGWAAGVDGWRMTKRAVGAALRRAGGDPGAPAGPPGPDATTGDPRTGRDTPRDEAPDTADDGAPRPGGLFDALTRRFTRRRTPDGPATGPGTPPRPGDWRDGEIADGEIVDDPGANPGRTIPTPVDDAEVIHDPTIDGIFPRPARGIPTLNIPLVQIGIPMSSELTAAAAETYSQVMTAASGSAEAATDIGGQAGQHATIAATRAASADARAQALDALSASAARAAAAWAASTQNAAERGVDQASVGAMADSVQVYQAMAAKTAQAAQLSDQIAQAEAALASLMPGVQGDAENAAQVAGQVRATLANHQGGFREETARVGHGSADHDFLLA